MTHLVCVEELEARWIAHVSDLPVCFASNSDQKAAIEAVPGAVNRYLAWCELHDLPSPDTSQGTAVNEIIRAWSYEPKYEVNAFFATDRHPLRQEELPRFEQLLAASRADLLAIAGDLSTSVMQAELPGERWPIAGILKHVANAEWWYLDRMDLALSWEAPPEDPFDRLRRKREHLLRNLRGLARKTGIAMRSGEIWSARKVLRRALWHERDHTEHIEKLRNRLEAA